MGCSTDQIFSNARSQLGLPYVFGGESPGKNFDCSGLTQWAAGAAGCPLAAHASTDQWFQCTHLDRSQAVPGDLVFFNESGGTPPLAAHVGVCADPGCTQMIDAPHTGAFIRTEAVDGFGQITGFGRVPGATPGGGAGATLVGSFTGGIPNPTDPQQVAEALFGWLFGGIDFRQIMIRALEITGGALILGAGLVGVAAVVATGRSSSATPTIRRTARGYTRQATKATKAVRRLPTEQGGRGPKQPTEAQVRDLKRAGGVQDRRLRRQREQAETESEFAEYDRRGGARTQGIPRDKRIPGETRRQREETRREREEPFA